MTDDDDSPHLSAGDLDAEVYLGFADNDRSTTPEQIATVDGALDEAGVRHRAEVYRGAAHGYTMADTPAYDEAAPSATTRSSSRCWSARSHRV